MPNVSWPIGGGSSCPRRPGTTSRNCWMRQSPALLSWLPFSASQRCSTPRNSPVPKQPLHAPVPLAKHHDVADFRSGAEELDEWLHDVGWVNHRSGNSRVFVATRGDRRVVGYYALATAGVEKTDAPERVTKGGVPAQVPCLLLARLAVDTTEHNRGLGRGLLVDAIRRAVRVSEEVGI